MSSPESTNSTADADVATPLDQAAELAQLRARAEELEQKNLRLIADSRNVAQRSQREKQEAIKFAEFDFAREFLSILDDLERTQESARTASDPAAIADGVRITYDHFLKLL